MKMQWISFLTFLGTVGACADADPKDTSFVATADGLPSARAPLGTVLAFFEAEMTERTAEISFVTFRTGAPGCANCSEEVTFPPRDAGLAFAQLPTGGRETVGQFKVTPTALMGSDGTSVQGLDANTWTFVADGFTLSASYIGTAELSISGNRGDTGSHFTLKQGEQFHP